MGAEPAYLKGIPVHTVALHFFSLSAHRIVCGNKGNVRVIFEVLVVAYHKPAYEVVVSRPALAGRVTAGIHEYLQLFLIRKLSEHVKLIVEVVVKNDYIVVLFKLLRGLFGVGDTLAGRACDLIVRVLLSDIVLKERRIHDNSVHAVIGCLHDHIAERVAEVLLFKRRICKGKAQRYALRIESLNRLPYKTLVAFSTDNSAAVPQRRRKRTVNRCYFNSLTEVLRTAF